MRILTGIKPTGDGMHLGNYFGAFQPLLNLSKKGETFLMVADLHSLTSVHEGEVLKKNKKRLLLEYLALLDDDTEIIIFEQSKLVRHTDIQWVLSSVTPYSLMLRAHSFKDANAKNSEVNMATFNYPILMAADILNLDTDVVPVGKDQKQHLEFTRDIAENFNKTYKTDFFKLPEPFIDKALMTIVGTDGRKMSKSYNNFIGIFDDEKTMKKRIMSIQTDDKTLEDVKDPDTCSVFALIKLFADEDKQEEIAANYRTGGYGYGHAKLELLDLILTHFKKARERYKSMSEDDTIIEKRLESGNLRAQDLVEEKYKGIRQLIGL